MTTGLDGQDCKYIAVSLMLAAHGSAGALGEIVGLRRYNYGEFEATVNIVTGQLNGELPKRALAHVQEWRMLHQNEILEAWGLAQAQQSLPKIVPLE